MLGIYRVAAQLVASRVVLSFTELVSYLVIKINLDVTDKRRPFIFDMFLVTLTNYNS
jgi:hypothetical protein